MNENTDTNRVGKKEKKKDRTSVDFMEYLWFFPIESSMEIQTKFNL